MSATLSTQNMEKILELLQTLSENDLLATYMYIDSIQKRIIAEKKQKYEMEKRAMYDTLFSQILEKIPQLINTLKILYRGVIVDCIVKNVPPVEFSKKNGCYDRRIANIDRNQSFCQLIENTKSLDQITEETMGSYVSYLSNSELFIAITQIPEKYKQIDISDLSVLGYVPKNLIYGMCDLKAEINDHNILVHLPYHPAWYGSYTLVSSAYCRGFICDSVFVETVNQISQNVTIRSLGKYGDNMYELKMKINEW
jgi:hypothetical protein